MVPGLSAKPSYCEDAGAVEQIGCRAGKRAKFLSRHARASDAEQMRFCLKTHNNKPLVTKKSGFFLICQGKVNLSGPVTSKPQFFLFGERFSPKRLIFLSRPGGLERFPAAPNLWFEESLRSTTSASPQAA